VRDEVKVQIINLGRWWWRTSKAYGGPFASKSAAMKAYRVKTKRKRR
jgi:hypothetical protein